MKKGPWILLDNGQLFVLCGQATESEFD